MTIGGESVLAVTGSGGFLGYHLRAAARAIGARVLPVTLGDAFNVEDVSRALDEATHVFHLAGVNRGPENEVAIQNTRFASQLAECLLRVDNPISRVVYANSIHSTSDSNYGRSKAEAGSILQAACKSRGVTYQDFLLPNLFGEFGQPFYNSFVATFCHKIAAGQEPEILDDATVPLLHAQRAIDYLFSHTTPGRMNVPATRRRVTELRDNLLDFKDIYRDGSIPDLDDEFNIDLFNTFRSYLFTGESSFLHRSHVDSRGSFFEIVRSHGGRGQTSISTTMPGISRGDHFHRRKFERFTVLSGRGLIQLRRLFDTEVFDFEVDGEAPASVDMPTFYTHRIVNTGTSPLLTAFWTNDLFDPSRPDTTAEVV